jgi:hypothetical protein
VKRCGRIKQIAIGLFQRIPQLPHEAVIVLARVPSVAVISI